MVFNDLGVGEDHEAAGIGHFAVTGQVDYRDPHQFTDLRGGEAHTAGKGAHGVDQVGRHPLDLNGLSRDGHLFEAGVRVDQDLTDRHAGSERRLIQFPQAHLQAGLLPDPVQRFL